MNDSSPVQTDSAPPTPYFADEQITLYLGDALATLRGLPSGSVDCCVTSPPYFGLRDYGVEGQYGLEASPAEYVETMRSLFSEVRRVLTDDGTLWVNIGDSYNAYNNNRGPSASLSAAVDGARNSCRPGLTDPTLPTKSLLMIPARTAIALQDEGWTLRAEIIWAKRNFMPEAVTDRVTRAHEQVYMLTKGARYWYDADAIREDSDPDQQAHNEKYAKVYAAQADRAATTGQPGNNNSAGIHSRPGKAGRNARSVWPISAQPFPEAHFATMPPALAERCVLAGCKPGGVVLDPFSGSGTTGMAANKHGRRYVGIDLSADYLDLSLRTRFAEPGFDFGGVA